MGVFFRWEIKLLICFCFFFYERFSVEASDQAVGLNNIVLKQEPKRDWFLTFIQLGFVFSIVEHIIFRVLDALDRSETERMQLEENERMLEEMQREYFFADHQLDAGECRDRFDAVFEKVVGQEKAKNKIKQQFLSHLLKIKGFYFEMEKEKKKRLSYGQPVDNTKSRRGPGLEFYCFVGPAGVGKTFSADLLVEAYCPDQKGKKIFTIDSSTLLSFEKKKRNPVALLGHVNKYHEGKLISVNSNFFSFVKATPRGFIVFNELDKLLKDPDLKQALFEFLRSIKEEGYVTSDTGEQVDCSGLTFIFTSNDPKMISDESLKTRFDMVLFEGFSKEEYCELARLHLGSCLKSINNMLKDQGRELSFSLSEEGCIAIAEEIFNDKEMSSKGVRIIKKNFTDKLSAFLFDYIFPSNDAWDLFNLSGRRVLSYNREKSQFFFL